MNISEIISVIETFAPPSLQEDYDNAGLITGNAAWNCTGVLFALDITTDVLQEAIHQKCNLVLAHHPIIFKGLKKINGKNYVEQAVIFAIKNDIAIYAAHTNADNVQAGVNGKIAQKLHLEKPVILQPKHHLLRKLVTFAPTNQAEQVRAALFKAGSGYIGNYSECSFNSEGTGTFKAQPGAAPYVGEIGERHYENETRIEVVYPAYLETAIIYALLKNHPYEEVAYDLFNLENIHPGIGSGMIGQLSQPMSEESFLQEVKETFQIPVIRHTALLRKPVQRVAVCGGAGVFLIKEAIRQQADIFITADIKYHDFFDAEGKIVLADIGHYESEQYTVELFYDLIKEKFPNFAVLKTGVNTNPVKYYL